MRRSTLALVRRLVSGVRSSWAASWMSRSCASRAAASRVSMVLNADARRADLVGPVHEHLPVDAPVHADVLGDAGQRLEAAGDPPGQQPADAAPR